MHKIKKGIKKKIKGKKGKYEDIFTEEEYERYKKQKEEEKQLEEESTKEEIPNSSIQETHVEEPEGSKSEEENGDREDWRNFLSSADIVLKQTSENLEQIKESSFFQAKQKNGEERLIEDTPIRPNSPLDLGKNWVDLDKKGFSDDEEEDTNKVELPTEPEKSLHERVRDLKEIAPIENIPSVDTEDYADIFDTTYVDQVESGDIKLHIIPDSPTDFDQSQPDPFDTSVVEKLFHKEKAKGKKKDKKDIKKKALKETSPFVEPVKPVIKKKIVVNLGSAVQALTNEAPIEASPKVNKSNSTRIVPDINLLRGDSVENNSENSDNQKPAESKQQEKESEVDIAVPSDNIADLPISNCKPDENLSENLENSENPELHKKISITFSPADAKEPEEEGNDYKGDNLKNIVDEFDVISKTTESIPSSNLELITQSSEKRKELDDEFSILAEESLSKNKENSIDLHEDDPFDTTAAGKVIGDITHNTSFETAINKESEIEQTDILSTENIESDPFDTSGIDNFTVDPFDTVGDKEDLPETLVPESVTSDIKEDCFDPFDTSAVGDLGKTELKFLEQELLSVDKKAEDDFDFNPREEETPVDKQIVKEPECLLSTNGENIVEPVLSPQEFLLTEFIDPFDTSIADKLQIKDLERELLEEDNSSNHSLAQSSNISNDKNSVISNIQVLSSEPSLIAAINADIDPFDTSVADSICAKVILETEEQSYKPKDQLGLKLKPPRPPSPACLLASTPLDENPTLFPTYKSPIKEISTETETEIDPFDTSIAGQFGKIELKALESELLTNVCQDSVVDFASFNPREDEPTEVELSVNRTSPACLLTTTEHIEQPLPPLSPRKFTSFEENHQIDPFDTSVADKLGISELNFFESQLEPEDNNFPTNNLPTINNVTPHITTAAAQPSNCIFAVTPTDNNPALQPIGQFVEPKEADTAEDIDPFDTSIAEQFGKTELRALEDSLLTDNINKKRTPLPDIQEAGIPANNIIHILSQSPSLDKQPFLQPVTAVDNSNPIEEYDPFDTSIADKLGTTELKAFESELLSESGVKRYLSDEEFNPREEESKSPRLVH